MERRESFVRRVKDSEGDVLDGEMTTALSNVVLAFVATGLAWSVRGDKRGFLFAAFGVAAFAASVGALFHGLHHAAPEPVLRGLWKLVLVGLAFASALLLMPAVLLADLTSRVERIILGLALVKLALVLVWATQSNSVTVAGIDFVLTLMAIAVLEWRRTTSDGRAFWSLAAVGVTILALVLQATGFRHGKPFGHNDAFHLIQAGGLALFCVGLRRRPEPNP